MSNRICSLLLLCVSLVCICLCPAFLAAQEFSADLVRTGEESNNRPDAKVYVGKDKMRFESGRADQQDHGAMIMDLANHKTYILMPEQKMYMEWTPEQMGAKQLSDWMRPADPNNACPTFQAADLEKKLTSCRKVGSDMVNGRPAIKYEGATKDGSGTIWIDSKLRFLSKWQTKDGSGELRDIKEGSQSASLFEIPAGYQKFDINAMRNQRKQNH